MTADIVHLPTRGDYWGGCPVCRRNNGFLSIGPKHWVVCNVHKVKWHVGYNIFSGGHEMPAEQRFKNRDKLAQYREVEPINDWNESELSNNELGQDPPF
jgi:hypothetical protein